MVEARFVVLAALMLTAVPVAVAPSAAAAPNETSCNFTVGGVVGEAGCTAIKIFHVAQCFAIGNAC